MTRELSSNERVQYLVEAKKRGDCSVVEFPGGYKIEWKPGRKPSWWGKDTGQGKVEENPKEPGKAQGEAGRTRGRRDEADTDVDALRGSEAARGADFRTPEEKRKHEAAQGRNKGRATWKRVEMSERDWDLVRWAWEQKFLTFDQCKRWFPELEPTSRYLHQRLQKLVAFQFLTRVTVPGESRWAYIAGELGHDRLVSRGLVPEASRLTDIDWKSYDHDQVVTELRWAFERDWKLATGWKSERAVRRELSRQDIPDAVLTPASGKEIALEVELTRKNLRRYAAYLGRYLGQDARWPRVLYVVPTIADAAHFLSTAVPAACHAIQDEHPGAAPKLHHLGVTALDEMRTKGLDARMWHRPKGHQGRDATWITHPLRQLR